MFEGQMKQIPLYARDGEIQGYTLVDDEDVVLAESRRWHLNQGRAVAPIRDEAGIWRAIHLAREILGLPRHADGLEADHVNRVPLDNRRSNLRVVTHAQNLQNKGAYRNARSIYRGVYRQKNRWRAEARLAGRKYSIGSFVNEEDAARAASAWRSAHMPYAVEA